MVVLVLVLVWIAVLAPKVVRYFRDERGNGSIESFHQQLHLLERTGPKIVPPAHTLETADPARPSPEHPIAGPSRAGPDRPDLVLVDSAAWRRAAAGRTPSGALGGNGAGGMVWLSAEGRTDRRRRARRRRRDLVLCLVGAASLTAPLGALRGLHALWALTMISALVIVGLWALGAYAQLLDAERRAPRPIPGARSVPVAPPWAGRARHAAGRAAGYLVGQPAGPGAPEPAGREGESWAARAGYPGAWDDDAIGAAVAAQHAAAGG